MLYDISIQVCHTTYNCEFNLEWSGEINMNISYNSTVHTIPEKYIAYSPFLTTLKNTEVGKDMDENGNYIVPYDPTNYLKFLQYGIVDGYDMETYNFMGHENMHGYSDEYFKIRLEDRWIRDNMYKYGLINTELYGLVEMETRQFMSKVRSYIKKIKELFVDCNPIIAGGMALYIAGGSEKYGDIDVFFYGDDCDRAKHILDMHHSSFGFNDKCATHNEHNYQVIFRKYKSPSEVVHGFDIDCSGFLFYKNKLYGTKRAAYSLKNKVNWFDPDRMSPSYVYRLAKYARRGYDIKCPGIDEKNFNTKLFMIDILKHGEDTSKINKHKNVITPDEYKQLYDEISDLGFLSLDKINLYNIIKNGVSYRRQFIYDRAYKYRVNSTEPANILLIAAFMKLYPYQTVSDYDRGRQLSFDELKTLPIIHRRDPGLQPPPGFTQYNIPSSSNAEVDRPRLAYTPPIRPEVPSLIRPEMKKGGNLPEWLEQDPMTQITSTFNPEPIINLEDYYSKSQYYLP